MKRSSRHGALGFSLIEATIVVAVIALAAGVVVASVGNTALSEIRQTTGRLGGTIRATYDEAVLTGSRHRIVFTIDKESPSITVEGVPSGQGSAGGGSALAMAAEAQDDKDKSPIKNPAPWLGDISSTVELPESMGGGDGEGSAAAMMGAFLSMGSVMAMDLGGSDNFSSIDKKVPLNKGEIIMDVWIEGMDKPATEGKVFLNFFPHGYTQRAVIHLRSRNEHVFAIKVSPLTGKIEILSGYQEPSR